MCLFYIGSYGYPPSFFIFKEVFHVCHRSATEIWLLEIRR
jgi:hypothetical protein